MKISNYLQLLEIKFRTSSGQTNLIDFLWFIFFGNFYVDLNLQVNV